VSVIEALALLAWNRRLHGVSPRHDVVVSLEIAHNRTDHGARQRDLDDVKVVTAVVKEKRTVRSRDPQHDGFEWTTPRIGCGRT